jgi:hypothetical protein
LIPYHAKWLVLGEGHDFHLCLSPNSFVRCPEASRQPPLRCAPCQLSPCHQWLQHPLPSLHPYQLERGQHPDASECLPVGHLVHWEMRPAGLATAQPQHVASFCLRSKFDRSWRECGFEIGNVGRSLVGFDDQIICCNFGVLVREERKD